MVLIFQVVSEEHEKKPLEFSKILDIDVHLAEVEKIVAKDLNVSKTQITVWIDPLDATQEYTEMTDKGKQTQEAVNNQSKQSN